MSEPTGRARRVAEYVIVLALIALAMWAVRQASAEDLCLTDPRCGLQ